LSAGVNAAYEGLDTLMVEASLTAGGQAKFSSRIENYPGFPVGVTGARITQNMLTQATRLGAEMKLGTRVTGMSYDDKTGLKTLTFSNGEKVVSRSVIIAGGLEFVKMNFPGSEGPGVVIGDPKQLAEAGKGGTICVIGGSNGAAQAALGSAVTCDHVYILSRSPIDKGMSENQVTAVKSNPKVTIIQGEIAKLNRDAKGNPVSMETKDGKTIAVNAVGVFVGQVPKTDWLSVQKNDKGKISTTNDFKVKSGEGDAVIPGVFAVGDMRTEGAGRVLVAAGEGQQALRFAYNYLDQQRIDYEESHPKKAYSANATIDDILAVDLEHPWFGQTIENVTTLKTDKDFDPDKHPRVPAGSPQGGQFGHGTGETSPEGTSENFDPAVVEVGGDEWNRQVARKLEREYQAAKPALDKLTNEAVRASELTDQLNEKPKDTWDSLSAEQQDVAYWQWFDENKDNYETGATAKEAWDKLSDEEKVEFALHGPDQEVEDEDEEE
jgi:thioredoxin reductase